MEKLLTYYDIYTYKQRENIRYTITSTVVWIEKGVIKLKDSNRLFYHDFGSISQDYVETKVEIIYKLIIEGKYLKAIAIDVRKL